MKQLFSLVFFLLPFLLKGQSSDFYFHHIRDINGLSYNIVNCFLKDSRGFLWIGTYNGLNRYDGAHIRIFRKEKTRNSLPNNTVHDLAEDRQGNIWGGTESGIFCYNPVNNSFKNYRVTPDKDFPVIYNILVDKKGDIWASNAYEIVKYNASKDSFESLPLAPSSAKLYTRIFTRKNGLADSPDGRGLWIVSREGLIYYDKQTGEFISAKNSKDPLLFIPANASALCSTSSGHYWFFDNDTRRLVAFDPEKKKIKFSIQPKELDNAFGVTTIFEDNNHLLWISTWNYEIFTIDYRNGNVIKRVQHDKNNRTSVAGDFFWAAMHEQNGTLWLGTVGGISRCNTSRTFYRIHYFPDELLAKQGASFNFVTVNEKDNTWWLGTTNNLLIQYNPASGKITSADLGKIRVNKSGLFPSVITRILFTGDSTVLCSENGTWISHKGNAFQPMTLPGTSDAVLIKDGVQLSDTVCCFTDGKLLYKWNRRNNSTAVLSYKQGLTINDKDPFIQYLTVTPDHKLWMLSGTDWFGYAGTAEIIPVKASSGNYPQSLGYYTAMTADKSGNLWAVKKGDGLYCYNPKENKYSRYSQYDGLVMDHIIDAAADATGRIWTAAYNQFSVFNPANNSFYNFTMPLNENRYGYNNFMALLPGGNIISSVADKMVEFFPSRVRSYDPGQQPIISALFVGGKERPIKGDQTIFLSPGDNNLQIKFGLLADPEDSPFEVYYLLEGAENNWSVSGNSFEAHYNKLQPGSYTFRVKAAAKDKSWETKETILRIKLAAPYYKRPWFLILVVLLAGVLLYLIYRYRILQQKQVMQLENKAQQLEKEKAMVMYESLKQQLNPHFLFNSLTSLSGLIETNQRVAGDFLEQMSGIYRYILKNGNNETVSLKDEIEFVQLYINLQQTRFKKGLQVNIRVPDEYLHYKIAPVTLQNLIENAIKHNVIDIGSPLVVDIFIDGDYLVVKNNLQRKKVVETSNRKGLAQFTSLYRYLSELPVIIEETEKEFMIKIPLI